MKTVRTVIASNDVPYFQMRSVGSYSMSEMEKEERMGSMTLFIIDTFTTQLQNINMLTGREIALSSKVLGFNVNKCLSYYVQKAVSIKLLYMYFLNSCCYFIT